MKIGNLHGVEQGWNPSKQWRGKHGCQKHRAGLECRPEGTKDVGRVDVGGVVGEDQCAAEVFHLIQTTDGQAVAQAKDARGQEPEEVAQREHAGSSAKGLMVDPILWDFVNDCNRSSMRKRF